MRYDYRHEQEVHFQRLRDLEDAADQREQKQRPERLRTLATGLKKSLDIVSFFERNGIDVSAMPKQILMALKDLVPEV